MSSTLKIQPENYDILAMYIFLLAAAIGLLALGEQVGWWAILGATLIVQGVAIATLRGERTPDGGAIA